MPQPMTAIREWGIVTSWFREDMQDIIPHGAESVAQAARLVPALPKARFIVALYPD